jgi:hypothetical protein
MKVVSFPGEKTVLQPTLLIPWQVRSTLIPHYVVVYNSHNTQHTCWFLRREENRRTRRKTLVARERTTHQTNSTHGKGKTRSVVGRKNKIYPFVRNLNLNLNLNLEICHDFPLTQIMT